MIAYFDCYSGVSGDMVLGALVDAGLPVQRLRDELSKLPIDGYELDVQTVNRRGFKGTQVTVKVADHGQRESRHLPHIVCLLERSHLSASVKAKVNRIFHLLAEAEATVHGISVDEVHFHEVGAVDAIVDIVGAVAGLEALGVANVYASPIATGRGLIDAAHGPIPVPGPAVLELLKMASAPAYQGAIEAELATPTGVAILAGLAAFRSPKMRPKAIGYGFGQRDVPWPNALRVWLGEPYPDFVEDAVCLIETNIDDDTAEVLGAVMDELFARGAADVYFTPIQMKKNRPATKLSIIAPLGLRSQLAEVVLRNTSALGVRFVEMERLICQRWQESIETPWGPVRVKVKTIAGERGASPEYEDCLKVAREHGIPIGQVYEAVRSALTAQNS